MTTRKAKAKTNAKAKANARAKADPLRGWQLERNGENKRYGNSWLADTGWKDIFPGRVSSFDQFDLLRSGPSLEFFFAGDCVADIAEVFVVDESMDVVAFRVGSGGSFAVCDDSALDVISDANVKIPRTAGENVDPEVIFAGGHCGRVTGRVGWGKLKSRSPSGMTTRKAKAEAKATTTATAWQRLRWLVDCFIYDHQTARWMGTRVTLWTVKGRGNSHGKDATVAEMLFG
jgi:hypothetical protein